MSSSAVSFESVNVPSHIAQTCGFCETTTTGRFVHHPRDRDHEDLMHIGCAKKMLMTNADTCTLCHRKVDPLSLLDPEEIAEREEVSEDPESPIEEPEQEEPEAERVEGDSSRKGKPGPLGPGSSELHLGGVRSPFQIIPRPSGRGSPRKGKPGPLGPGSSELHLGGVRSPFQIIPRPSGRGSPTCDDEAIC